MMIASDRQTLTGQFPLVTFRLGDQHYALPIDNVLEVQAMLAVSTVPNAPPALLGIANRHGDALPMLDLRVVFNLSASVLDVSTLFIVAQSQSVQAGLVVDEIFPVVYIQETARKVARGTGKYVTHLITINNTLFQQLNLEALLTEHLAQ